MPEADMVVIAAGRHEGGLGAVALHQLEAEDAAIEAERPVEIGHLQVDMADPHAGIDGTGGRNTGFIEGSDRCGHGLFPYAEWAERGPGTVADPPRTA
jgi:hypothetical protein